MITIKKILCPVDFFAASETAVNYAIGLAKNYESEVKLLHVVSPVIPTAYEFPLNTADILKSMEEESKRELNKLISKVSDAGVAVHSEVLAGDVYGQLKIAIASYKPDLVAMGTHGRRGFERWFLGSTTERLMRHSPVPLLTLSAAKGTPAEAPRYRRIMVTTDFSAGTTDALNYAFSIAQEHQARIVLLHVVHDMPSEFALRYRAPLLKGVESELSALIPPEVSDWCEVESRVRTGTPYQVILDLLDKEKVDLLVMNIHGKGMLDRALVGSTAERVVRAATCPVMLVPPMRKPVKRARPRKTAA